MHENEEAQNASISDYSGIKELAALESAVNYNNWLVELSKPYLGKRVLEIGAGIGTFTIKWLENCPEVTAIEPSVNCIDKMKARYQKYVDTRLKILPITIQDYTPAKEDQFDTVISFNVFEHIEDDKTAFNIVKKALVPGGNFILFVPAFQCLYGEVDASVGHVRRYDKNDLLKKLKYSGLNVLKIHYVNMVGFFAWYLKGRRNYSRITNKDVVFYDKFIVPWLKVVEKWCRPPFGQSIFAVAQKKASGD